MASDFSEEMLRMYYGRLFPYGPFFKWLSYGQDPESDNPLVDKDFFAKREFSFTMQDDIYIRYLSFKNEADMKSWIQKKQPHKIDIGAVYTCSPAMHTTVKATSFYPTERELVFDIDVTDYELQKETIWNGTSMSKTIWPFMAAVVKVLDVALREDFGFKHLLWIYSGRRGIHCWVCDPEARALTNEGRSAVADYLSVEVGNESNGRKVELKGSVLHPRLQKAYDTLEPMFIDTIAGEKGQGLFCDEEKWQVVLKMIPSPEIQAKLNAAWLADKDETSPADKWKQLKDTVAEAVDKHQKKRQKSAGQGFVDTTDLRRSPVDIVFYYLYPRLDVNVSKARNHLLKSPFVIHPKTGRVCIPIDTSKIDEFNPETVPSLTTMADQINAYDEKHGSKAEGVEDFKKTDMAGHIAFFEKSFLKPMLQTIKKDFRDKSEAAAASTGDW
jgi:DNA primase small subunit